MIEEYQEKLNQLAGLRFKNIRELKTSISSMLQMKVKTISKQEEVLIGCDDNFNVDLTSPENTGKKYALAEIYFLKDNAKRYFITETHFAFE